MMSSFSLKKELVASTKIVLIFTFIGFAIDFAVYRLFFSQQALYYPIYILFVIFMIMSLCIVAVLNVIRSKNIDYVGYTYLMITFIKMIIAYVFLKPILNNSIENQSFDKSNFFLIFIYFLIIETLLTIRILNNKH